MNLEGNLTSKQVLQGGLSAQYGTRGLSAYEVAVSFGFEGTEEEWLESLKGDMSDMSEYVKNTDYATQDKGGVVKVSGLDYGILISGGTLRIREPSEWNILYGRKNGAYSPVTLSKVDLVVKEALKNPLVEWTEEEKASVRGQIGASSDIISSASGEVITTTDSAKAKPKNIRLYGKNEQKQYEGNQLVESFTVPNTVNAYDFALMVLADLQPSTTYTISFKGTVGNQLYLNENLFTTSETITIKSGTNTMTFTTLENVSGTNEYWIFKNLVNQPSANVFSDVMLNEGTEAKPLEPFTGNEPSPSINYPQPTNHLGESGSIEGKFIGENLIDVTGILGREWATELDNSVKTTINGDELIVEVLRRSNNIIIPLLKKVRGSWSRYMEFTFSDGITENRKWNIMMDSSSYGGELYSSGEGSGNYYIGGNTDYVNRIQIGCGDVWFEAGTTITLTRSYVNETGNGFTPYIVPQPFTALTPNGFKGIGDVKDYVDFERGKFVQRVKEVNLSDLTWIKDWNDYYALDGTFLVYAILKDMPTHAESLLTHFSKVNNLLTKTEVGFSTSCGQNSLGIRVPTSVASNLDEWNEWCISSGAKFTYILADPITTDLTEEEMAQYNALHMNYPNTTIINNENAYMEVEYVADTKCYIDNKFKEMTSAIAQLL